MKKQTTLQRELARMILKMEAPQGCNPSFARFKRAVTTNRPGPVPIGDLFADTDTVGNFLREPVIDYTSILEDPEHRIKPRDIERGFKYVGQSIRFSALNDWDYVTSFSVIPFAHVSFQISRNTSTEVKKGKRGWVDDNQGPITNWDDFERFPWPSVYEVWPYNLMSRIAALRVPDGMKVMVIPGGIFEWSTRLMGLTPFCYALTDNPQLVDAVINKVARLISVMLEDLMDEPNIGGIFMGDDMGFATGTMVSPSVLRRKFFPHIKRIANLAILRENFSFFIPAEMSMR